MEVNEGFRFSEDFYKNLGPLKGELKEPSSMDRARLMVAASYIKGNSLLDIGTYWGNLLKLAKAKGKEIFGTEVNDIRCSEANGQIGIKSVRKDFLHGRLDTFEKESVDTVSCMEVLEHTDDLTTAVSELMRVARKRIIVTVPYREELEHYLCIHCNKLTPQMNHLHEFNEERIRCLFGPEAKIKIFRFGVKFLYKIPLPLKLKIKLDCIMSCFLKTRWIFAIIDK